MLIPKWIFPRISLTVATLLVLHTGLIPELVASPLRSANLQATEEITPEPINSIRGRFDVNERSMYLDCLGVGSPTLVFEAGEGGTTHEFSELQERLSDHFMTCAYDRAGNGRSDSASVPRTALEVAEVPEPYILVGHSAGGLFVQLYARNFPDQVVGVVAMNPVPPADPWLEEVRALFSAEEYVEEEAYFAGTNGESLDYLTSSEQVAIAPEPPDIPFEMLISTDVQCEGAQICLKSYSIYEETIKALTDEWPCGNFSQVEEPHNIFSENPQVIVDMIEHILTASLPDAESCTATQPTD